MSKKILLCCLILLFISCKGEKKHTNIAENHNNTAIKIIDFKGLESLLKVSDTKTYVINFWATWCKPCVKELPYFNELDEAYADNDLKIILVSLDFPEKLNEKLIPFIKKHHITQEVMLLDAPNENEWIPKIDSTWSGAIPATLIFDKEQKSFYEKSFSKDELFDVVKKFINNTKT